MKKTILTAVFIAVALVSCQDKTKEKIEDAKDAIGTEVEQKIDTVTEKAETAIDTAKAKVKDAVAKGAEKVEEGAKKVQESVKK